MVRWLRGVLDAAAPLLEPCIGSVAYFMSSSGPSFEGLATAGTPWFRSEEVVEVLNRIPPEAVRAVHFRPTRVAATLSESFGHGEVPHALYEQYFREIGEMRQRASDQLRAAAIRDFLGVFAFDAEGRGVMVTGVYDHVFALDRASCRRWTLVAVHIATAARLHRALEAEQPQPAAVLTPSGRIAHAEGEATSRPVRATLRDRVIAIDRARGRMRRSNPDAALETWKGLVSGRWSLVDRFESDGRRYVVAHRNEPVPARMLSLTLRERQAVGHLLAGHSSKLAAYALGISPAAVSAALRSAMQKLNARSPAQLIRRRGNALTGAAVTDVGLRTGALESNA